MLDKTQTTAIRWSPQQADFIRFCEKGSGSVVLEAVAGAGKSTTLIEGARVISGQVALMAYNKKIAEELEKKLQAAGMDWKKAQAKTAHGFAFAAYRKQRQGVRLDERKVKTLVENAVADPKAPAFLAVYVDQIAELISLAKQAAVGIVVSPNNRAVWEDLAEHYGIFDEEDGPVPPEAKLAVLRTARDLLDTSTKMLDIIDFDDMIYMPLVHRCRFWQFDVVMVDEAQDTNASRRALVRAMVKRGGRVIAVGDRHQAIYGFTGADSDSLDLIAQDFNCRRLPLTVTYRCPKAVVRFSQQWVSHIQAHESAPEGNVSASSMEDFLQRNDLDGSAAVLSRTTAPLVSLAFKLLRQRTPCRIEGRNIAENIKKLIQRWKVKTLDALESRLDIYLAKETTKLLAAKKEAKLASVEDAVETVRVIIGQCRKEGKTTLADAVAYVDNMFADDATNLLVLSTIHKAKGREWRRVFWLDRAGTCPNKWARQDWQVEQENNLCYVAATRAQEELVDLQPAPKETTAK